MTTEPEPNAPSTKVLPGFDRIAVQLGELEHALLELETQMQLAIQAVPDTHRESAKNLVHYVALRQRDLRELQAQLAQRGLSSLGRSESCVMRGLLEVSLRAHESLIAQKHDNRAELERLSKCCQATITWDSAQELLHRHTVDVFGPRPSDRHVYAMVTAPSAEE